MSDCRVVQSEVWSVMGIWKVEYCDKGLHSLKLKDIFDGTFLGDYPCNNNNNRDNPPAAKKIKLEENSPLILAHLKMWMDNYFNGNFDELEFDDPDICPSVLEPTKFRSKVWLTLKYSIPTGETVTYKELAKMAGNEKASRAVGSAMANNPIALIIPCHRVIRSNDSVGNYSKGTQNLAKEFLIDHEMIYQAILDANKKKSEDK